MSAKNLNHFKSLTAYSLFVRPADHDYILSRWMLLSQFEGMFWHASQAMEKYLKAALLLNGINIATSNHDLVALYERHCDVFGEMALKKFARPEMMNHKIWNDRTVNDFIETISMLGSPDSRYGLVSFFREPDDLFKFDQACWHFRRLTIGLDWRIGEDFPAQPPLEAWTGRTYREALSEDPGASPRGHPQGLNARVFNQAESRGDLLHLWNFSFRRSESDLTARAPSSIAPIFGPFRNSELVLLWEVLSEKDAEGDLKKLDPVFKLGMEWLIEHVKFPPWVKREIQRMLSADRSE